MKYLIAPITTYNEYDELFETKIAADVQGLPLICCVYGKTENGSRENAKAVVSILQQ